MTSSVRHQLTMTIHGPRRSPTVVAVSNRVRTGRGWKPGTISIALAGFFSKLATPAALYYRADLPEWQHVMCMIALGVCGRHIVAVEMETLKRLPAARRMTLPVV